MKKQAYLITMILVMILGSSMIIADIQITTPKNNNTSYIIVVGQDGNKLDSTAANTISFAMRNQNFNTKIIQDYKYVDDNVSNIILIGGSCVNKITAQSLNLDYPTCGYDFTQATQTSDNQFLFKTLPLSNNRIMIIIAGYEKLDTFTGSRYFLTQNFTSLRSNLVDVRSSNMSSQE